MTCLHRGVSENDTVKKTDLKAVLVTKSLCIFVLHLTHSWATFNYMLWTLKNKHSVFVLRTKPVISCESGYWFFWSEYDLHTLHQMTQCLKTHQLSLQECFVISLPCWFINQCSVVTDRKSCVDFARVWMNDTDRWGNKSRRTTGWHPDRKLVDIY